MGYILHSEVSQSNLRKYKTMVRVWFVRDHRNILEEPIKFCLIKNIKQCSRIPLLIFTFLVEIEGKSLKGANSFILHSTKTKLLKNRIPSVGAIH